MVNPWSIYTWKNLKTSDKTLLDVQYDSNHLEFGSADLPWIEQNWHSEAVSQWSLRRTLVMIEELCLQAKFTWKTSGKTYGTLWDPNNRHAPQSSQDSIQRWLPRDSRWGARHEATKPAVGHARVTNRRSAVAVRCLHGVERQVYFSCFCQVSIHWCLGSVGS